MPRFRMRNDEVFMKHAQKWIAGLLVLALAAGFSGCTQPQTPSQASSQAPSQKSIAVGDWLVEPYLEAACITGIREDSQPQDAQQVFSHLAIQTQPGGGWQYLNAVTGRIFPQKESAAFVGMTFFALFPGTIPVVQSSFLRSVRHIGAWHGSGRWSSCAGPDL